MDVTLPDGTLIKDVPDGMSKADLTAKLKGNGYDVSKLTPPAAPSRMDQFTAGLQNFAGKNAVLGAVRGAAGIGATLQHAFNPMEWGNAPADAERRQGIDEGLKSLGADPNSILFKNGKLATEIAGTSGVGGLIAKPLVAAAPALESLAPAIAPYVGRLANSIGSAGFTTGAPAAGNALAQVANVGTRMAGGAITGAASTGLIDPNTMGTGAVVGAVVPPALKLAGVAAAPIGNAISKLGSTPLAAGRQAAVDSARAAGLVLPPTEINPNALNSIAEGLSGKIKTAQAASFKNQPVINTMAAHALGLDPAVPITQDILKGVRKDAGQAYEAMRNAGTVTADAGWNQALDRIAEKYKGVAQDFPGLAKSDVPDMVDSLRQKQFSASGAVDAIGILRETADKAFATRDKGLANAAKSAADELESLLGRHLEASGADPALVAQFQNARATIAKSYSVGKALNEADGTISAKALAKQLDKGVPLTGELDTIARAGKAFPEATQALTRNPNALSPLDYAAGIMNAKNSLSAAAAGLAARPLARGAILSEPYQNFAARGAGGVDVNALAALAYRGAPRSVQNGSR